MEKTPSIVLPVAQALRSSSPAAEGAQAGKLTITVAIEGRALPPHAMNVIVHPVAKRSRSLSQRASSSSMGQWPASG